MVTSIHTVSVLALFSIPMLFNPSSIYDATVCWFLERSAHWLLSTPYPDFDSTLKTSCFCPKMTVVPWGQTGSWSLLASLAVVQCFRSIVSPTSSITGLVSLISEFFIMGEPVFLVFRLSEPSFSRFYREGGSEHHDFRSFPFFSAGGGFINGSAEPL